jgi:hypothetical protein
MFYNSIAVQSQWQMFKTFFLSGEPPLVVQLLILNTFFFIYLLYKRVKRKPSGPSAMINNLQLLLIGANLLVVMQGDIFATTWEHIVRTVVPTY